jgi:hypothetical protein
MYWNAKNKTHWLVVWGLAGCGFGTMFMLIVFYYVRNNIKGDDPKLKLYIT